MQPFKLSEAQIGQRVVVIEPIEDEFRWKHFERRDGEATFSKKYVPVFSLRTVQGRPGQKPRWDSGEGRCPSEMPAAAMVVDGKTINHDWTEAHAGLMVVQSNCWTGIYLNSRLIHKISPAEHVSDKIDIVRKLVEAMDDVPFARASAIYNGLVLPDDLSMLKLEIQTE